MYTQKDQNSEFFNQDLLGRKRRQWCYQERRKNRSATIWSFPSQGLTLWSPEKKVARARVAGWDLILYGGAHEIVSIPIQRFKEIHLNVQAITLESQND